jgi:hypothetical protein
MGLGAADRGMVSGAQRGTPRMVGGGRKKIIQMKKKPKRE